MKWPFIFYSDLECALKKWALFHNNHEKQSTTNINKHTPSGYSLFTHCSLDATKNKLDFYRSKDCMERFSKDFEQLQ